MLFITSLAAFGLIEALAYRYGTESRPGFDERPERGPRRDI